MPRPEKRDNSQHAKMPHPSRGPVARKKEHARDGGNWKTSAQASGPATVRTRCGIPQSTKPSGLIRNPTIQSTSPRASSRGRTVDSGEEAVPFPFRAAPIRRRRRTTTQDQGCRSTTLDPAGLPQRRPTRALENTQQGVSVKLVTCPPCAAASSTSSCQWTSARLARATCRCKDRADAPTATHPTLIPQPCPLFHAPFRSYCCANSSATRSAAFP